MTSTGASVPSVALCLSSQAHSDEYLTQFEAGALEPMAMRRIGFPWSQALVDRTLSEVCSTVLYCTGAFYGQRWTLSESELLSIHHCRYGLGVGDDSSVRCI